MDIELFVLSIIFLSVGIIITLRNKYWKFVGEELKISLNPFNGASNADRILSGALGVGLGAAALPKTIFMLSTSGGVNNIISNYIKSNSGVTNTPNR